MEITFLKGEFIDWYTLLTDDVIVLTSVGYATGFFGKWHLGDTEFSYVHNQGYDEAFFTPYKWWKPSIPAERVISPKAASACHAWPPGPA